MCVIVRRSRYVRPGANRCSETPRNLEALTPAAYLRISSRLMMSK
jgi:hypothetical protein